MHRQKEPQTTARNEESDNQPTSTTTKPQIWDQGNKNTPEQERSSTALKNEVKSTKVVRNRHQTADNGRKLVKPRQYKKNTKAAETPQSEVDKK